MTAKYRSTGEFSRAGFMKGLIICIAVAGITGGLGHLIGRYIYLIILFPVVMGVIGGATIRYVIRSGKIRNYSIAIVLALVWGVATYASMHYFDFIQFENEFSQAVFHSDAPRDNTSALLDNFLISETGFNGFVGYMIFKARQGTSISRHGKKILSLEERGTYIYWIIELFIVLGITLAGASAAKEPFCSRCELWYNESVIAVTTTESVSEIQKALEVGDYSKIADCLKSGSEELFALIIASRCPHCEYSDVVIKIQEVKIDKKGRQKTKEIYEAVVPFSGFTQIVTALAASQHAQPATPSA